MYLLLSNVNARKHSNLILMIISKTNSKEYTISIAGREVQHQHTKGPGRGYNFL